MVCVADGTELAAEKLDRVLTADPGTGVMRHADAGYERAIEVAAERGVRDPDGAERVTVLPIREIGDPVLRERGARGHARGAGLARGADARSTT